MSNDPGHWWNPENWDSEGLGDGGGHMCLEQEITNKNVHGHEFFVVFFCLFVFVFSAGD